MALKQNFELMAKYNQWINEQIYFASATLNHAEIVKDRGAFFGSILGSLNHILVGDTLWLKRFAQHPSNYKSLESVKALATPLSLSEIICSDFCQLQKAREHMDVAIINFSIEASEKDYEYELSYKNTKGQILKKKFGYLVHHFYNHQTHHRGQVTTLLSQLGIDTGVTDLLTVIP